MAVQSCSDSEQVVASHQPGLSESFFVSDLQTVGVGTKTGLAAKCLESNSAKRQQMLSHSWLVQWWSSNTTSKWAAASLVHSLALLSLLLLSFFLMIKRLFCAWGAMQSLNAFTTLMWLSCQTTSCSVICSARLPCQTMWCSVMFHICFSVVSCSNCLAKWWAQESKDSPFPNHFLVLLLCRDVSIDGCLWTHLVLLDARHKDNEALEALDGWIGKCWCWLSQRIDVGCPKGLMVDVDCSKGLMDFCMVCALDLMLETC